MLSMAQQYDSFGHQPYVGVTGYTALGEAQHVARKVKPLLGTHVLMDGYLVRAEDLDPHWKSNAPAPVDFAKRYLTIEKGKQVFGKPSHGSLRFVHFRTGCEHASTSSLTHARQSWVKASTGSKSTGLNTPTLRNCHDSFVSRINIELG